MLGRLRLFIGGVRELRDEVECLQVECNALRSRMVNQQQKLHDAARQLSAEVAASRQVQRENEVLRRRIEDFKLDRVVITSLAANVLRAAETLVDETTDWKVAG